MIEKALRFAAGRLLTLGLYCCAIVGSSNWDRDPDSWSLTFFHIVAPAVWLWWAVARTVRHGREDDDREA